MPAKNRCLLVVALAGAVLVHGRPASAQEKKAPRPNIVLIMADDMGYSDIGCYGGEVRTPNVDRLAKGGLRFTNFFNTARCCPTRASLMTGLYPHQAGVGHMTQNRKRPGYQGELNRTSVTIAEVLRLFGYSPYMVGKWHLTGDGRMKEPNNSWPLGRGFERFFGTISGGGSYYRPGPLTRDNQPLEAPAKGFYYTDAISDHAVQFIADHRRKQKDDPFFLYVAYTSPHWPLHALKEDVARYRDVYKKGWDVLRRERHERMKKLGIVDPKWVPSPRDKEIPAWDGLSAAQKGEMAHKMAVYAAQIDRMDQGIGRILAALKQTGAEDNTLVLFLADNGGCAEGGLFGFERQPGGVVGEDSSFASYGQCWAWLSSAIFRLYKHWVHAGGVSTPLIAYWPRHIGEQGTLRRQPGHLIDVMATCIDVAGARYPAEYKGNRITPLEGKSLVPAFANKAIEREAIYWEHEGHRAVLAGKWKLVSLKRAGGWELYDIEADRTETNDLAAKHPERVKTLDAMWEKWAERAHVKPWPPAVEKKKAK
ncbi:MAG: arylsulfatase [Gemmataceae bacterium]|nr:arylsulfatase [Gemmataceae bacterium]